MSKIMSRIFSLFSSRNSVGVDKSGNRYFTRIEKVDGIMKEKRWIIFKAEQDPTTVPVEWICWLNGQRKKAPTPEEMNDMEARRERVRLNVALLKKEEEEKKAKGGNSVRKSATTSKTVGPDLKSFIQQFPADSEGEKPKEALDSTDHIRSKRESGSDEAVPESTEPTGSGASYRPGTWQPPT